MTNKTRFNLTLDPEVVNKVKQRYSNLSGLVNKLLEALAEDRLQDDEFAKSSLETDIENFLTQAKPWVIPFHDPKDSVVMRHGRLIKARVLLLDDDPTIPLSEVLSNGEGYYLFIERLASDYSLAILAVDRINVVNGSRLLLTLGRSTND